MDITYSFIIPHRNSPNLLNRCLDSIPLRSDLEIIVVDDNSEINKKPVIKRPDTTVILLKAQESKWAGHARNVGMKKAKGKWLLFADADDFYNAGFLDVLDKYSDKEIDVLYFNADSCDSETLKKTSRNDKLNHLISEYDGSKQSEEALKYLIHAPWNKMFNHSFVVKHKICFEEIIKGNDVQFGHLAGYFARKINIEKTPLYVTTCSKYSMSFTKKRPIESYVCSAEMKIKLNYFYQYIGHEEWKNNKSWLRYIVRVLIDQGVIFGFKFLLAFYNRMKERNTFENRYVELINNYSFTK